jgi:hypothetical protein
MRYVGQPEANQFRAKERSTNERLAAQRGANRERCCLEVRRSWADFLLLCFLR